MDHVPTLSAWPYGRQPLGDTPSYGVPTRELRV